MALGLSDLKAQSCDRGCNTASSKVKQSLHQVSFFRAASIRSSPRAMASIPVA